MSHELLLKHMHGATSQAPISVDDLVAKTGLLHDTIIALLDQMHHQTPAPINKVTITRAGKTSIVCWPTGQIQRFSYAQTNTLLHKPRIPREPIKTKEPIMQTEKIDNVEVPRTLQILQYVEHHPGCSLSEITEKTKIASPKAYIKTYADKGLVIIEGERGHKLVTLKHGTTAQDIFNNRRQTAAAKKSTNINSQLIKAVNDTAQASQTPAAEEPQATEAEKAKQTAFAQPSAQLQAQAEQGVLANKPDLDIPVYLPKTEAEQDKPAEHYGKFRCAYTSDGSMLIYGLQYTPIELSKAQLHVLCTFAQQQSLI